MTEKDPKRLSELRQTSQAAFAAPSFSSWLISKEIFFNKIYCLSIHIVINLFCCYHWLLGIQGQKSPTETRKALDNVHYLFYIFLLTLTWTFEDEILDWKMKVCILLFLVWRKWRQKLNLAIMNMVLQAFDVCCTYILCMQILSKLNEWMMIKHKLLKQFCNFSFVSRPGVLREKTLRKCLQKQQGGKDENCKLSPNKQRS